MSVKIKNQEGFIQTPLLISIIVSIAVISVGTYGGFEYYKISKVVKESKQLAREEKYDEAIKKLEAIQNNFLVKKIGLKKQEINNEIEINKRNLEDKSKFIQALKKIDEGNYPEAIDLLSDFPENSFYYQKAKNKIAEVKNKIVEKQILEKEAKFLEETKRTLEKTQNESKTESENLKKEIEKLKQEIKELKESTQQQENEEKTNLITETDLQKVMPYIGDITCVGFDEWGTLIINEGSASLWTLGYPKKGDNLVFTNAHILPYSLVRCTTIFGDLPSEILPRSEYLPIFLSEGADNVIIKLEKENMDFAVLKLSKVAPKKFLSGPGDYLPTPPLTSELFSIPPCPQKLSIGSPVAIIGYPLSGETEVFGGRRRNKIVTTGIISGYDDAPIFNGYPDVNYFVSAKVDKGNSGGLAFSKYNGKLCILGIPTRAQKGYFESMGLIQSFRNIFNF